MKKILTYLFLSSTMISLPIFAQTTPDPQEYQNRRIAELKQARDQTLQDIEQGNYANPDNFCVEGLGGRCRPQCLDNGTKPISELSDSEIEAQVQNEIGYSFITPNHKEEEAAAQQAIAAAKHAQEEYYKQSLPD